jgi:hypothetical protein
MKPLLQAITVTSQFHCTSTSIPKPFMNYVFNSKYKENDTVFHSVYILHKQSMSSSETGRQII